MSSNQIKIEDIVAVTQLESRTKVMTIKNGLLAEGKETPILHLATNDQDVYDMACESLMRFYMANRPAAALKAPSINTIVDMASAFHATTPEKKESVTTQPQKPAISAGSIIFDW